MESIRKNAGPNIGLAVARMMAHITYLSDDRHGRKSLEETSSPIPAMPLSLKLKATLDHQGRKFVDRFDANTYLKLTKGA